MIILIKFIARYIKENIPRFLLIFSAIVLSGGLIFTSLGLTESLLNTYKEQLTQLVGNTELQVTADNKSPSYFLNRSYVEEVSEQVDYIMPVIDDTVKFYYDNNSYSFVHIKGVDINKYKNKAILDLIQTKEEICENDEVIISTKTAQKYGLKMGDPVVCIINGAKKILRVGSIADQTGIFADESQTTYMLMPIDALAGYYGARGKASSIYIKTKGDVEAIRKILQDLYPQYVVRDAVSISGYKNSVNMIQLPLIIISSIIIFMSCFIIYSIFKTIVLERISILGTFRSIGASRGQLIFILQLESIIYGMIGGIFACIIGYGVLRVANWSILHKPMPVEMAINKFMITFTSCIIISFFSSLVPIYKITRIEPKKIILSNMAFDENTVKECRWIGYTCVIGSIIFIQIMKNSMVVGIFGLVGSMIGIVLLIPRYLKDICYIFEKIFKVLNYNIGLLAIRNINMNKAMINNIQLTTIAVAVIMLITNLSTNIKQEVLNMYVNDIQYDIECVPVYKNRSTEYKLKHIKGITDIYKVYESKNVDVIQWKDKIDYIVGVQDSRYSNFIKLDGLEDKKELLDKLQEGRSIILCSVLKERFNLEIGDEITLKTGSTEHTYKIIGFFYSLLWNGSYGIVGENYLKMDMKLPGYSRLYIKTSEDSNEIKHIIEQQLDYNYYALSTKNEMYVENNNRNNQIISFLNGIIILGIGIGTFGTINNLTIYFMKYKRQLAVLKSIGLSNKQAFKITLIQISIVASIGAVIGIIGGSVWLYIIPSILNGIGLPIRISIIVEYFIGYIIGAILVFYIVSFKMIRTLQKINIVKEIKFE